MMLDHDIDFDEIRSTPSTYWDNPNCPRNILYKLVALYPSFVISRQDDFELVSLAMRSDFNIFFRLKNPSIDIQKLWLKIFMNYYTNPMGYRKHIEMCDTFLALKNSNISPFILNKIKDYIDKNYYKHPSYMVFLCTVIDHPNYNKIATLILDELNVQKEDIK